MHKTPANSEPWDTPKTLADAIALSNRLAALAESFRGKE